MVICYSNNFLFLRLPKNASSSLSEFFVQNYCDSAKDKWTMVNDCGIKDNNIPKPLIDKYRHQTRFIHLMLQEVIDNEIITTEQAINLPKIACIREPLDRQLSLYFFLYRNKRGQISPKHFREQFVTGCHITDTNNCNLQSDFLKINGEYKGKTTHWSYDNLSISLQNFAKEKNIPLKSPIANRKSGLKPKKKTLIDEYYDVTTRKAVEKYYEKDYELYYKVLDNETNQGVHTQN